MPSSKSKNGVDLRKHETEMEQLQGQRLVPDNHMPKQKPIRHYRTIRSACLGCAKPVHLVRMSDGTYEWQHDADRRDDGTPSEARGWQAARVHGQGARDDRESGGGRP